MARNATAGFEALVRHGADVTAQYRDPALLSDGTKLGYIIRLALTADNREFLRAILKHGFDPNYILYEETRETLLFTSVEEHVEPAMQILLDAGAAIDHRNSAGFTAMEMAMLGRDYRSAWFLLQRGANPLIKSDSGTDMPALFKTYGSRGVRPDQREFFEKVVDELVKRGLLTHQDIIEADKPKRSASRDNSPGITVIEHSPDSEAGQAIRELDRREREANRRESR
jgi:ankyrin repeat protein